MPSFSSFGALILLLSILCPSVLSRESRPRAKQLEDAFSNKDENEKRDICYDDDTLQSFKYWIIDSEPYCSSLLGIVDCTETLPLTTRTTTSTLSTTLAVVTATTTVPAVTIISTTFVPDATPMLEKRQDATPTPATTEAPFYQQNPYAYEVINDDGGSNASIASTYYSACKCLYLTSSTVTEFDIFSSTRIIPGVDSRQTTSYVYVTSGTTTIIATRNGALPPLTTVSSTVYVQPTPISTGLTTLTLGTGTGNPSGGLPSAHIGIYYHSFKYNHPVAIHVWFSNAILEFQYLLAADICLPNQFCQFKRLITTILCVPNQFGQFKFLINTILWFPNKFGQFKRFITNLTASSIPSSGVPYPSSNGTITPAPASGFPLPSANSTFLTLPSQGFPTTSTNQSASPQPTSGFPLPTSNTTRISLSLSFQSPLTPSVSPSYATLSGASTETFTFPGSESTTASTSALTTITYLPSVTPTPSDGSPSIDPPLEPPVCPGLDGTTIDLTDGQKFAVVCETDYGGPVTVGLIEPSFQACVLDCATANNGFSAVRCRGVTYIRNTRPGDQNCFYKNLASLDQALQNPNAVSAVLILIPQLNTTIPVPTSFPTATPRP
ncbi:MAG: hypothetical protein Q9174_004881 [Haloplaca sp. 1 TL-2023]